mgnify:CR=1 FL=1
MKKLSLLSGVFAALLLANGIAEARVCLVRDFDTSACRKGDDLLYMPPRWGNVQLPIEFIAYKCDSTRQISYTDGAVSCVYAGPKELYDVEEERKFAAYRSTYESVRKNPKGWFAASDGRFWRLDNTRSLKGGSKAPVDLGDTIKTYAALCTHDFDGTEHLDDSYRFDAEFEVTPTHDIYRAGRLVDGTVLELVGPTQHLFVGVELVKKKEPKKGGTR